MSQGITNKASQVLYMMFLIHLAFKRITYMHGDKILAVVLNPFIKYYNYPWDSFIIMQVPRVSLFITFCTIFTGL